MDSSSSYPLALQLSPPSPTRPPIDARLSAAASSRQSLQCSISLRNKEHQQKVEAIKLNQAAETARARTKLESRHQAAAERRAGLSSPTRAGYNSTHYTSSDCFSSPERGPALSPPLPDEMLLLPPPTLSTTRLAQAATRRNLLNEKRKAKLNFAASRALEALERKQMHLEERSTKAAQAMLHAMSVCAKLRATKLIQKAQRRAAARNSVLAALLPALSSLAALSALTTLTYGDLTTSMQTPPTLAHAERISTVVALPKRTVLAAFLVAAHPTAVLGDDASPPAIAASLTSTRVVACAKMVLHRPTATAVDSLVLSCRTFSTSFAEWMDKDKSSMVDDLKESCTETWVCYLESVAALKCLEELGADEEANKKLFMRHEEGRAEAKKHLVRLRRAFDQMLSKAAGKQVLTSCKREAEKMVDLAAVRLHVTSDVSAAPPLSPPSPTPPAPSSLLSNPDLVHRVLLTPKSKLHDLTVLGGPRIETPVFAPDDDDDFTNSPPSIELAMKRAFFDLCTSEMAAGNPSLFNDALQTLKMKVADLTPSREDLRATILATPRSPGSLLAELAFVGETLAPLESAERASSTLAWLDLVTSAPAADSPLLVKSLEFLLLKVDLCAIDVADSKFQQLAPFIHANGVAYEKRFFKKEWGEETVPAGINQFLSGLDSAPPLRSEWRNSFVEGVLFGKHGAMLPECFNRDTDLLMETRKAATVVSVVNSLIVHAGNLWGVPALPRNELLLLELLSDDSTQLVEDAVVDAVVALGSASSTAVPVARVQGLVRSVLNATDAVSKLMEKRAVGVVNLVVSHEENLNLVPAMRTGLMAKGTTTTGAKDAAEAWGENECARVGLKVGKERLVELALTMKSAIDLGYDVVVGSED